ncbi:S8 family peptidase [Clostridium beijerinckii]|uniref:S8 family peptidase n=1 Tax=Clostridium beijerinckii TaxID=1520 RepID=UPI0006BB49D8|nr:S8 family serine peptidase [Clostridium beijerinckii]ALB44930.1 peptidase S8 [Clostridium beijerinckii NRRL B-598]
MKNKKKKILYAITLIISFIMLTINIPANAEGVKSKNIDLVILFNDNAIDKNVEYIITNSGGEIINEFSDIGGIEAECTPDLIPTIKAEDTIQSLAPNHVIKLSNEETKEFTAPENDSNGISNDLYEENQWDIKRVTNNGKSFDLESGNHDVVVGIIDSGVDIDHPDLATNCLGGKNLVPANFQYDSSETGDTDDINDRLGHGTNIAGVIAANGRTKGVAPNIGFKSYRIFNKYGQTNATIISSAIIKATDDDVKVINLSIEGYDLKGKHYWTDPENKNKYDMGNDTAEYSLFKRAVEYAIKNGVTVVAAAGNEGLDCSNKKKLTEYLNDEYGHDGSKYTGITYEVPGDIKGAITVSATSKEDKITSYSNYGKDFIDISAPGGNSSGMNKDLCLTTTLDGDYIFTSGTSIAAPKVSAVAALIICQHKGISPKLVARKICSTSDPLGVNSLSEYYGAGMVNAFNAIQ